MAEMRTGFIASGALHVGAFVVGFVVLPSTFDLPSTMTTVVPVDLVTISDQTNVRAQVQSPEPKPEAAEQAAPPQEQPRTAPPPQPEPPAPEPEPAPQTAEAPPAPKPAPPEPKKEEPRPQPKREEPRKREEFDLDRIAGLIDVLDKEQQQNPAPQQQASSARNVQGAGLQSDMTASEIDALLSQMARCWRVPADAPDPASLIVRVRVHLNQDGTLARPPEVLDQARLMAGDLFYRRAVEAAVMAINVCVPYKLPPEKFDTWRQIVMTFDPTKMAGLR